jgi:hypothetical protein
MALDRLGNTVVAGAIYALAGAVRRIDGNAVLIALGVDREKAIRVQADEIARVDDMTSGGGGGAPTTASYLTAASEAGLSNEYVVATTATIACDVSVPGTAKWSVVAGSLGATQMTATTFLDNDGTLAANSATRVPTQQAIVSYFNLGAVLLLGQVDIKDQASPWKAACSCASTANIVLGSAVTAVDGVTLTNNMRVLVKNQTTGSENGIYSWNSGTSLLTRAVDSNSGLLFLSQYVDVTFGTANGGTTWRQGTAPFNFGVDTAVYSKVLPVTAGTGISVTGGVVAISDAELLALAGLTSAADKLPYFTGSGTAALADFTSVARSLLDDTSIANMRTTLGLTIGTDVQAFDAELAAIAGLTSAADKLPYFTGSGTAALADFSSTARSLVDDTSFSAMRTTLGLVIGTNVQAPSLIATQISIGGSDTITNSALATTFATTKSIPAGAANASGALIRITARGTYNGQGTSTTQKFDLMFNGTAVASTGSLTVAKSGTRGWVVQVDCIVTTTGASAQLDFQGFCHLGNAATSALTSDMLNTTTKTVDLTASITVAIQETMGAAVASWSVTQRHLTVEVLQLVP